MTALTLREALVDGRYVDVSFRDGMIAGIRPASSGTGSDAELRLEGRPLIPGLWDAHTHMTQWAMHAQRPSTFSAGSAHEAMAIMRDARHRLPEQLDDTGSPLPLVGVGFRDGLWPDAPTAALLDQAGEGPIVVISSDLHSAWLNTAALERSGFAGHPSGLLREAEAFEATRRINEIPDRVLDGWVDEAGQAAAARGVVGIEDFEMTWNLGSWQRRIDRGWRHQRVAFTVYPQHLDRAIDEGLRTGTRISDLVTVGLLKLMTDGSLGTRTAYCFDPYPELLGAAAHGHLALSPEQLAELLARGRAAGFEAAVHAIGDQANSHALDVFGELGIRGRIEHAQLLTAADVTRFAQLGVTASVQPEHAVDDRDLADLHWHGRTERVIPLRSLADAGVPLVFGSDAPVANLDPWIAIAAAVHRSKDDRDPWHQEQAVSVAEAVAASVRSTIAVGQPADLVALDADPASADPARLRQMPVALTLLGGDTTHSTL